MARLVIYGAGGFGRELMTAARSCGREIALIDQAPVEAFAGINMIREDDLLPTDEIVIGISDGETRKRIAGRLSGFARLIAPTAVIGHSVDIGEGAVICDFSMVTACAKIGRHFHCNIYSYVAHDCVIGDFVTFAPKVCCNGNIRIGDGVYIGTGAVIRQGRSDKPLTIGEGAVIGMGAVVTRDVLPGVTVVGNPARPMVRTIHRSTVDQAMPA